MSFNADLDVILKHARSNIEKMMAQPNQIPSRVLCSCLITANHPTHSHNLVSV
jgi:hypothetical protein